MKHQPVGTSVGGWLKRIAVRRALPRGGSLVAISIANSEANQAAGLRGFGARVRPSARMVR